MLESAPQLKNVFSYVASEDCEFIVMNLSVEEWDIAVAVHESSKDFYDVS